jgi:hypothetical protein
MPPDTILRYDAGLPKMPWLASAGQPTCCSERPEAKCPGPLCLEEGGNVGMERQRRGGITKMQRCTTNIANGPAGFSAI